VEHSIPATFCTGGSKSGNTSCISEFGTVVALSWRPRPESA
jgi:hypothetical protein